MRRFINLTKALADESRVRALMLLRDGELCLCQIIDLLGLSPSTVSKHMTILLAADLVEYRKEGRWHFYRFPDSPDPLVRQALDWACEALAESPAVLEDRRKIKAIRKKSKESLCECYKS